MESANALNRQTKAVLIAKLLTATKGNAETEEKVLWAALIGGVAGCLLGIALATM
jgi:hypothetical protein